MHCRICDSKNVIVVWDKPIREGGLGQFTKMNVPMYKCSDCDAIWHGPVVENIDEYYESNIYRDAVDGGHSELQFYKHHDYEVLNRLEYTGTEMFRGKEVADVGCAAGTFLDYLNGVASKIVAIEPSEYYRDILSKKGYEVYDYGDSCAQKRGESLDVVVSFSVIEHVEDPVSFLKNIYDMLKIGGKAVVGTPSDAPLMCGLLGDDIYEKEVLYSVQHLWVLSKLSMKKMGEKVGFKNVKVESFQRYGMSNLMGWLKNKKAKTSVGDDFCNGTIDAVFKERVRELGIGDYLVAYLEK